MRVVVSDVGSQNMCDGGHVNCDLQVVLEAVFSLYQLESEAFIVLRLLRLDARLCVIESLNMNLPSWRSFEISKS